jgi:hypothetical protein
MKSKRKSTFHWEVYQLFNPTEKRLARTLLLLAMGGRRPERREHQKPGNLEKAPTTRGL